MAIRSVATAAGWDVDEIVEARSEVVSNSFTDTTLYSGRKIEVEYSPATAPQQTIACAQISKFRYEASVSNTGVGHCMASLSWYVHEGTGNPVLAIAHEAKFENSVAATISIGKGSEIQLAANVGTISAWMGCVSQIVSNAGTITVAILHDADVAANAGTIGTLIDFYAHDLTGKAGITTKYAFKNDDPLKLNLSASQWINQSRQNASPINEETVPVTALKSRLFLTPAGTIAGCTIALPAATTLVDGQELEVYSTQTVTTLSWSCTGAAFILAPTTITAAKGFVIQWDATNTIWWTKAS